jgi:hypothetical protein
MSLRYIVIISELVKGHVLKRILIEASGLRAVSNEEKNDCSQRGLVHSSTTTLVIVIL